MLRSFTLWFCLALYSFKVFALDVPIKYLGIEQGLSNNSVTCITQDHYGFIWLGTYDGLNRYDGYEFKTFRNVWGDARSLVNNHIKTIKAIGNRVYTGTEKGLMYFDYTDLKFHPLYVADATKPRKIDFNVDQVIADAAGNVYAATGEKGLLKFGPKDSVGVTIDVPLKQKRYSVQSIMLDRSERVWFVVSGMGLVRYDPANKRTAVLNTEVKGASSMALDRNNDVWLGNGNGVFIFETRTGRLYPSEVSPKLVATNISHLMFSARGEVWVSTNGSGINVWNPQSRSLRYIKAGESQSSLKSGAISEVFEDAEGRKWIATLRGGVNIIDKQNTLFKTFDHDAFNKNSAPNDFIRSFCEDGSGNIWIGTDGSGVSCWNAKTNVFRNYAHSNVKGSISSNYVVSIIKDHTGRLWFATFNGGIDEFDNNTQTFKHYACKRPVSGSEEKNPWILYEDAKHRLWAGSTWGGAMYLFNRKENRFELFDQRLKDIHAIFEDRNGTLWGGNYTRLIKIDPLNKRHVYYFVGQAIRAINEDNKQQLWVGTEGGGLLALDRHTNKFERFTENDGLPSNSVLNILIDNKSNIWFSTYNGLSKFVPATRKFSNYFASDGLQGNQFMYNAALKLRSGVMLFGGIKGFNSFDPDSVDAFVHQPRLQITDIKVGDQPINRTSFAVGQSVNDLKHIKIPFDQATLAINFTALEYSYPEKIRYAYYLEGWDHNWNYVNKVKAAYYSRLNEGEYTLKIKATDTEGQWSARPMVIKITVLPPWYRTWWAYLAYLTAASIAVFAFGRYRKRQIALTYEVQIANLKVEKEKEANEKKLSFFTNVSHEFRTPLTLIINPIKDLLSQSKGSNEELNIVYRNARRLLGLVDHLLLFRKTESENAELNISAVNFVELCTDVYTCFIHQAKIKHIKYTFDLQVPDLLVYVDRAKIEIALFNLISNAVKFTPDGGSISLALSQDENSVYFKVSDSGIGIQPDVGEKLFDKFYQVKDKNALKTGFGIGLYLVKTFMTSHHGTVDYESTVGGGTTFTLCLPKGKQHFGDQVIIDQVPDNGYSKELIDHDSADPNTLDEPQTNQLALLISDTQSVLVIDDNQEIRTYIKRIFTQYYIVYEADNGLQGWELIKKHLPDVVISDIKMPDLDGLELCQLIKKDSATSHIPVILLTGESAPDLRLKGIEEGAVDFINKPFDKDLLVARVKGIIKNKAELQNYFYREITLKGSSQNVSEDHKDFLYKCIEIIENSLMNPDFETNHIAERLGMSYSNLYKKIKAITGLSVNGFIRFVRLRKAAEIMINTNCNVNEAAYRVGYSDIKYFREHFNKQFGLNPSEFIKRHRTAFQRSYNIRQITGTGVRG